MDIYSVCADLRKAANVLAQHTEAKKNYALRCVLEAIKQSKAEILNANQRDVVAARAAGMSEALVERLALDEKKFSSLLNSIAIIIQQTDPVGQEVAGWTTTGGLQIHQTRVPLGVVAIIYESRPNVTVDAFALAYKSGNAILLRGSSSALESNKALTAAIQLGLKAAASNGVPNAIYLCQSVDHTDVNQILTAVGYIDVVLPRGGAKLINAVVANARVPVIQTGAGVCHLYVDESADIHMAVDIAVNAKTQRPGACNAIETILVNKKIAGEFLPLLARAFEDKVQMRADELCYPILQSVIKPADLWQEKPSTLVRASAEDFGYEFLDFIVAVKAVNSIDEAIEFINLHNTKHSEAIITNDRSHARAFQSRVDAACVYVNASTRFTDGGEFGFGAELGISTQKLHARGPMGITALTTTKFIIDGDGQIR